MDLHSTMIMYLTNTMVSPVIKIAKTSIWLRLKTFQNLKKNCPCDSISPRPPSPFVRDSRKKMDLAEQS